MLENIVTITDERSPGRKHPYWFYTVQCKRGGCTWWIKNKSLRKAENAFVDHDLDWHRPTHFF